MTLKMANPHKLSKHQSQITVFLRTPITHRWSFPIKTEYSWINMDWFFFITHHCIFTPTYSLKWCTRIPIKFPLVSPLNLLKTANQSTWLHYLTTLNVELKQQIPVTMFLTLFSWHENNIKMKMIWNQITVFTCV